MQLLGNRSLLIRVRLIGADGVRRLFSSAWIWRQEFGVLELVAAGPLLGQVQWRDLVDVNFVQRVTRMKSVCCEVFDSDLFVLDMLGLVAERLNRGKEKS